MTVSLTKEEFLQRLRERKQLFDMAMNYDIKKFKNKLESNITLKIESPNNITLDINAKQLSNELIGDAIFRLLDLIYEDLD